MTAQLNAHLVGRGNEVAIYELLYTLAVSYPLGFPTIARESVQEELAKWVNGRIKTVKVANFDEEYV